MGRAAAPTGRDVEGAVPYGVRPAFFRRDDPWSFVCPMYGGIRGRAMLVPTGRTFSRRGGYQPPEKKQPGESPWLLRVHAAVSKLWINSAVSKLWSNSADFKLRSGAVRFSSCAPRAAYCMPLMMELS